MKKFPTFFVIIDVIAALVWKFGKKIGDLLTKAGSSMKLGIGKINILAPFAAFTKGIGGVFKLISNIGKIVFIVALILTILLIIRFIISKVKYKKRMEKVDNLPSGEAVSPVAPTPVAPQAGVPTSAGPREIHGF